MALSAAGLGSGLDVNSIVEQLMELESRPLTLLARREASFQARLTTFGALKGAVASFQSAVTTLAGLDEPAFSATSSNATVFAASAESGGGIGTYSIDIAQLAQGQKLVAAGQTASNAAIGTGTDTTITFSRGTISGGTLANGVYAGASFTPDAAFSPVSIVIGASGNTLEGIRDAINAADAGVRATIVNDGSGTPYRLALSGTDTGAATSLKIEVAGESAIADLLAHDPAGTQNLVQTQAAQDAALTIDGVGITRPTNTVTGAIEGVTLTLKTPTTSTASVAVALNTGPATATVTGFVKAYNDLGAAIANATAKGTQLQGDAGILALQQRLRSAVGAVYGGVGTAYPNLSALGVSFRLDGLLSLDTAKLANALAADADGALATVAAAGTALQQTADAALADDGVLEAGTDRLNASIETINERRAALERRLQDTETRYRAQFTALDVMLSSMNQTSAFLQRQLAQLPSPTQSSGT